MRVLGSNHEASIDSILDSGELSINDRIIWRQREGHLKARLPVLHSEHRGIVLELTCALFFYFRGATPWAVIDLNLKAQLAIDI